MAKWRRKRCKFVIYNSEEKKTMECGQEAQFVMGKYRYLCPEHAEHVKGSGEDVEKLPPPPFNPWRQTKWS